MKQVVNLTFDDIYNAGGREQNQDYRQVCQRHSLFQFLVADGLGGQGGGKIASTKATQHMMLDIPQNRSEKVNSSDYFSTQWLALKFEDAHHYIREEQANKSELSRMATTMIVLMIDGDKAIWGHVGDSRLYLFRDGQIYHQTKDHSVPQMLVSSGEIEPEEMRNHPDQNRLLRALGDNRETVQARICKETDLQEGDVFLLCTDGFWEYVLEEEMLESLYKAVDPKDWLAEMEQKYLLPSVEKERVLKGEIQADNDNYTALAVWYGDKPSEYISRGSLFSRIREKSIEVWDDFQVFRQQHATEYEPNRRKKEVFDDIDDKQFVTSEKLNDMGRGVDHNLDIFSSHKPNIVEQQVINNTDIKQTVLAKKEGNISQKADKKLGKSLTSEPNKTMQEAFNSIKDKRYAVNKIGSVEKQKTDKDIDKTIKAIQRDFIGTRK